MAGEGPFLWLNEQGPPSGFRRLPPGGMCLSAFLFVRRGPELLLGKYADDPRWEKLAGLDAARVRQHGQGWTIPATHLKYGEDPRATARRVADDILDLHELRLGEPRVETEHASWERSRGSGWHYDVWFFVDAEMPMDSCVPAPPWYAALEWHDPRKLPAEQWARGHQDVVRRWMLSQ